MVNLISQIYNIFIPLGTLGQPSYFPIDIEEATSAQACDNGHWCTWDGLVSNVRQDSQNGKGYDAGGRFSKDSNVLRGLLSIPPRLV